MIQQTRFGVSLTLLLNLTDRRDVLRSPRLKELTRPWSLSACF